MRACCAGAQGGCVGGGTAQDARHVGQRDARYSPQDDGQKRTQHHHAQGRSDEPQSARAQGAEESRSDLQAEGIDEEDEAETFGEVEHLTVDAQAQVPGDDADEEDERRSERDAQEAYLAQSDPDGSDQRKDDHGLQSRVRRENIRKPRHAITNLCDGKSRSNFRFCRENVRIFRCAAGCGRVGSLPFGGKSLFLLR